MEEGVCVSRGVLGDPTGSCNETLRFLLTIQACSRSDDFLDNKWII
jgi:hypothetical protein